MSTHGSIGGSPREHASSASPREIDHGMWPSAPSSTEGDDAQNSPFSGQTAMSGPRPIIHDTASLDPSLLMGTSLPERDDRFNTPMHSISIPRPSSYNNDVSGFSFDHSISNSLLSMDLPPAQDEWNPTSSQIAWGCHLFFTHVSHFVPFLHRPSFNSTQIPNHLLLSILSLGYQYGEDPDSGYQDSSGATLSSCCFRRARSLILDEERNNDPTHNVSMVQAYLLLQIWAMMYSCGDDSAYGLKTHSKMISLARASGLMQPISIESAATEDLDSLWRHFVQSESQKRTVFAIHQIDTLWYQFLSIPRSLSHLEVKHDLPCPEDYWTASTSGEWAHRRLVSKHSGSRMQYSDAVRQFLSSDADLDLIPAFDPYGAINITQFLLSSAREVSGWSTMTGMLSMDRLEPLRSSLFALGPYIRSQSESAKDTPHAALCEATWETAMIEMQMWSPSHTGGIVEGSIDAVLHQLTYLAPSYEFLSESNIAKNIQPHLDWFLRYLEATLVPDSEAPWITLYAYKAFVIAWQLVRGGISGSMQVVGVEEGNVEAALSWARKVFQRRQRWQLGKIIMTCLDTLDGRRTELDETSVDGVMLT
ncbi:hypothetical protein K504DRAFT_462410 [Pleomassaria siparia CBS 279.74]|uniref:Xylanolytic transcriptional activator regulatory domain-containing protein n=1 Tax=Pleomassaria siparia CBS 279.74 TaxID=1314801 RepID=A0A6G1KMT1_9PLEO|nr:hypothetical protein K504DRAFT_462410 [Pleomassaria siparia CBS 279.74]